MNFTRYLKIGTIFLLVIILVGGGYFYFKQKKEEKSVGDDTKEEEKSQIKIAMDIIMNDPEIAIAMLDSRVRTAFQEIQKDIKNAEKYKDDPKIGPLIDKVLSQLDLPDKKKSSPKKPSPKKPSPKKPPRKQPSTNVSKPVAKTVAKTVTPKQEPQGASQTPASVTSIDYAAFYKCYSLTSLKFESLSKRTNLTLILKGAE